MYKIIFSATGRCEKVADGFCSAIRIASEFAASDAIAQIEAAVAKKETTEE